MRWLSTTAGCCANVLVVFGLTAESASATSDSRPAPCADPAVAIEIALISQTGPTSGRVRITGIVKNLGSVAWNATSSTHRLQLILAQKNSDARPNGEAVEPAIAIAHLSPGQQFRIDHQIDWEVKAMASYPRFIVQLFNVGRAGRSPAPARLDCRADNNRKEITPEDIDRVFGPAPTSGLPLSIQGYRLLRGIGGKTVETTLVYNRVSAAAGKITVSVAAPYSGTADEVPISGKTGAAKLRVDIPCDHRDGSSDSSMVTITYRLWGSFGQPGAASWVAGFSTEHSIPYKEMCR